MAAKLLIVDDEKNVRIFLGELFSGDDMEIAEAGTGAEAVITARSFKPDVVILDLKLPDALGSDLIKPLKEASPNCQIIIITALGTIQNAVAAIKAGAYDFITKPFDVDSITIAVDRCIEYAALDRENRILRRLQKESKLFQEFIGETAAVREIKSRIFKLADTQVPVLITGETGTGKNILAHQIHHMLNSVQSPLVYVNCATLSENLFESELFGHEKGSFTGAVDKKKGRVEEADGGTLILDEITEIPYNLQAKLLSFLQDQTFYRVGGRAQLRVNVRVIALTNRNLEEEIVGGGFRKDLFYRLNVIRFDIPPLRDRAADIPLLADHFISMFNSRYGRKTDGLKPEQHELLLSYGWPGNTRELKNILEQAFIYSDNGKLELKVLASRGPSSVNRSTSTNLKLNLENHEKALIIDALSRNDGNRARTAEELGVSVRTLHYRLSYYDIQT